MWKMKFDSFLRLSVMRSQWKLAKQASSPGSLGTTHTERLSNALWHLLFSRHGHHPRPHSTGLSYWRTGSIIKYWTSPISWSHSEGWLSCYSSFLHLKILSIFHKCDTLGTGKARSQCSGYLVWMSKPVISALINFNWLVSLTGKVTWDWIYDH